MPETFILVGDALQRLKDLDDNTFNVCVTSPPYFGLRNYGTASEWSGGNNPDCTHTKHFRYKVPQGVQGRISQEEGVREAERLGATPPPAINNKYTGAGKALGNGQFVCDICGAEKTDLQIGLEPDVYEYIDRMVEVCREVRRVLRPDGTFFLNIGDSYTASTGNKITGLKVKDLIQVPARLCIRLQEDGWWLRSEIIWAKTAPLPESVGDRPTASHEKILLLTKSPNYFFDGYAVEDLSVSGQDSANNFKRPQRLKQPNGSDDDWKDTSGGLRNMRSVWHLGPEQVPDWHVAPFPTEVPRRAILSGLGRAGVCAKCGAPWKSNKGRNWSPTCLCGSNKPVPGLVLDPFMGSGTTALVANSLGHDCVGIELNPDNARQARQRIIGNGRLTNKVSLDEIINQENARR